MQKINDSEKAALRLEVEKLHRGEAEWLQMLVHVFDHVFVLHAAAASSGQPKLAGQITQFQNACRDTVRRIGLTPFAAEPGEPFDAARHQVAESKEKPPAGAVVAETIGSGYTFQGRLLRPAIVRLRQPESAGCTAPETCPDGIARRGKCGRPAPARRARLNFDVHGLAGSEKMQPAVCDRARINSRQGAGVEFQLRFIMRVFARLIPRI